MTILTNAPTGANAAAVPTVSTLIPSLGMTFAEAAERFFVNHAEHLALPDEDTGGATELIDEWERIIRAVATAEIVTVADALAVLRIGSSAASPLRDELVDPEDAPAYTLFDATLRAATFLTSTPAEAAVPAPHARPKSTIIPTLGMTFVEARARHDAVNAEVQRLFEAGDDKVAEQADDECCLIINGMLATMPETVADALAALTIITDETLARLDATDEQEVGPALRAAATILSTMPAETATRAPHTALDSTVIPALGMTFIEAGARVRELFQAHNAIQGEDDESQSDRHALCEEWTGIKRAILATPPNTPADATAVLDRLLCPETGMPAGTTVVQDLEALDRIRSFLAELAPTVHPASLPLDPPHQPAEATGEPSDSAPHRPTIDPAEDGPNAAAVAAFRRRYARMLDRWHDWDDDEVLEAGFAVLAQRFTDALVTAGPPVSVMDALALAELQHDLLDEATVLKPPVVSGARAVMLKAIGDQLGHLTKRA